MGVHSSGYFDHIRHIQHSSIISLHIILSNEIKRPDIGRLFLL